MGLPPSQPLKTSEENDLKEPGAAGSRQPDLSRLLYNEQRVEAGLFVKDDEQAPVCLGLSRSRAALCGVAAELLLGRSVCRTADREVGRYGRTQP